MQHLKVTILLLITASCSYSQAQSKPSNSATYGASESAYDTPDKLSGVNWLQDKGIMLRRMSIDDEFKNGIKNADGKGEYAFLKDGRIDNRRMLPYDLAKEGTCITLKVQNDFSAINENASPATFSWTKDAGSSGKLEADAAIRLDFWTPLLYDANGAEASIALGYDINRSDVKGKEADLQSYHLSIPFVPKRITDHIPGLDSADQVFQLHLSYNQDGITGEDGFDVDTDYRPTFVLPFGSKKGYGFWVGTRCDFKGKPIDPTVVPTDFYYSVEPVAGINYGDKYSLGSPIASLDQEFVVSYQVSAKLGIPLGRGPHAMLVEASYTFKGGNSLSKSHDFAYNEVGLTIQPAKSTNPMSLNLAYRKGQDGFDAVALDRLVVGLGVKF